MIIHHHVTIAMHAGTAHVRCVCGWRPPALRAAAQRPGTDLPDRAGVIQLVNAQRVAGAHIRAHLLRRI